MSFWTAIVVIVLIASITRVMTARYRAQSGIIADQDGNETYVGRDNPEKDREIEELRERVKVLERIATDPARRTAEEIEKLRDER